MPEATSDKPSKKARDLFNKGFGALERGQLDYAINMFYTCIQMEPGYLQARKFLRAAEIQRGKQARGGWLRKAQALLKGLPKYGSAMATFRAGKAEQAMMAAEELLKDDPLNRKYVLLLARAADAAGMPDVAIQTLELAREQEPDDAELAKLAGELYLKAGRTSAARAAFERLVELRPHDLEAMRALKNAMALDSMATDGWARAQEKGGTYREIIKDTKEATLLEQESKAVKSERDVEALIAELRAKVQQEPENLNYRRALARLYAQKKQFDEAIGVIQEAQAISPGDPELDQQLSALQVQKYDEAIAQLEAAGDAAQAQAKKAERDEFVFRNLEERVKRYPNDLRLRFEWGAMLFERGALNEAIQQFQLSQRNLKYRPESLLYLGLCFKQKKQYDLAVDQLQMARSEIMVMNDVKKRVCYELGDTLERMDRKKEAIECYKQVYQVDIGYRDIAQRMERVYGSGG